MMWKVPANFEKQNESDARINGQIIVMESLIVSSWGHH